MGLSRALCHGLLELFPSDASLCFPSLVDGVLLTDGCLPARGGVGSVDWDGLPWGVWALGLVDWFRDGGLGLLLVLGKRENPPAECGVDIAPLAFDPVPLRFLCLPVLSFPSLLPLFFPFLLYSFPSPQGRGITICISGSGPATGT